MWKKPHFSRSFSWLKSNKEKQKKKNNKKAWLVTAVTQNYICCVEFPFQVLFSSSPSSWVLSLYILPSFLKSSPRFSVTLFLTVCLGYKMQCVSRASFLLLFPSERFTQPFASLGNSTQLQIWHLAVKLNFGSPGSEVIHVYFMWNSSWYKRFLLQHKTSTLWSTSVAHVSCVTTP